MNNRKRTLAIIGALLAACLILGAAGWLGTRAALARLADFASDDPRTVAQVGRSIAFYDLPPGFGHGRVVHQADYALVTYTAENGRSHLTLFQVPAAVELDGLSLAEHLRRLTRQEAPPPGIVAQHAAEVRGRAATLLISEGEGSYGPYRAATLLFEGLGGPALADITMPLPEWDDELVQTFMASLH